MSRLSKYDCHGNLLVMIAEIDLCYLLLAVSSTEASISMQTSEGLGVVGKLQRHQQNGHVSRSL